MPTRCHFKGVCFYYYYYYYYYWFYTWFLRVIKPNVPRGRCVYEVLSLQGTLLLLLLPPEMALRRDTRGSSCHIYIYIYINILEAKGRYAPHPPARC